MTGSGSGDPERSYDAVVRELPLLSRTPRSWAELAAGDLPTFLADHAVCEQQAALSGLTLVAHYPHDDELVEKMSSLAAEEVVHLRRVVRLLHRRGLKLARRRSNPYVNTLRAQLSKEREPWLKIDRLLVGALIEARSCERFSRLLEVVQDAEVADLLADLGPAEKRHWEMFHALARREAAAGELDERWQAWLRRESELVSSLGRSPHVHG
jgi:tRNA-(ms[2]io[6]A)-hydroxylase